MTTPWIIAFIALAVAVLFTILVLVGLLRRVTGALEQVEMRLADAPALPAVAGVTPGSVIPPFAVTDETGAVVTSSDLIRDPSIVLLVAPDCSSCKYLAREVDGAGESVDGLPLFVLVQSSEREGDLTFRAGRTLYDGQLEAARAFQTAATPIAFVLDRGGFVLDRTIPNSLDDLRVLALRQKGGAIPAQA